MNRQVYGFLLMLSIVGGLSISKQSVAQSAVNTVTIDQFITDQMVTQRVPGVAVAIIQGDQVRYLQGYGAAREQQPMTPQTQFHLASLSKSFTAVAIMQLVEASKIDLDLPVQHYLPEFKLADRTSAQQITVRQLLNHTSGLADAGVPDLRLARPATSAERIASLENARPVVAPGSAFHYTDVNYQILGRVVEVVSGEPLSAYLQAHIFTPLQMTQTVNVMTSFEVAQTADHLAQGHLLAFGIPVASGEEKGYLGGSAGVISTAADMANYLILHNNDGRFHGASILSPASVEVLHTPPPALHSEYAMGWLAHTVNGQRILEHNGILSTFYSEMVILPESRQGFVLLYNIHSLAQDAVGFPKFKAGLIALLSDQQPVTGGFSTGLWGLLIAAITVVSTGLGIRGLWNLSRWRQTAIDRPWWRHLLSIIWAFVPALLVLGMPALITSTAGRAFGYLTLFRSMMGVMICLGLAALLGVLSGVMRLLWLARWRFGTA